jgi:hypothetical protein
MRLETFIEGLNLNELLKSLIPDFVLSFAFFTSLAYAIMGKKFEKQRPAVAMSVSIGFALSIGLVWWEQANKLSIKNLGPIAVGFAILVLAFVMYQSIKQVGGTWAGVGITIGACILIAQLLQFNAPINPAIIQTITVVALIIGILTFLSHNHNKSLRFPNISASRPKVPRDLADIYRDRHLSDRISKSMRHLRKEANTLNEHPQDTGNVLLQLKRMLPAEGYLTERMAQLRVKAYQVRNGHIAKLEETKNVFAQMPTPAKKRASQELAARYDQLVGIDTRLERLDMSIAENERRIKELTEQAQAYTAKYDFQKLTTCLKAAENLQKHNSELFKIINHTEGKLTTIARKIAKEAQEVTQK